MALDILSCVLGGGSLVTLIIFLIQRHDTRNDELKRLYDKLDEIQKESSEQDKAIEKKMKRLEKDIVRTQLIQLMKAYEDEEEHELLQVAEHYFDVLKGNWYMTSMFKKFLKKHNIETPLWFKEK